MPATPQLVILLIPAHLLVPKKIEVLEMRICFVFLTCLGSDSAELIPLIPTVYGNINLRTPYYGSTFFKKEGWTNVHVATAILISDCVFAI